MVILMRQMSTLKATKTADVNEGMRHGGGLTKVVVPRRAKYLTPSPQSLQTTIGQAGVFGACTARKTRGGKAPKNQAPGGVSTNVSLECLAPCVMSDGHSTGRIIGAFGKCAGAKN
jgi:hypothetical protein